jgi:hypothetical protein
MFGRISAVAADSDIVRTAFTPAMFNVSRTVPTSITAESANPYDFVFVGWENQDGGVVADNPYLYGPPSTDSDLKALFRWGGFDNILAGIVPAVSSNGAGDPDWGASRLTNGRLISSRGDNGWTSGGHSSINATEWIRFDLGSNEADRKPFTRLHLYPRTDSRAADGGVPFFPVDFTIELSNNTNFNEAGGTITIVSETDYQKPSFASPAVFDLEQAYNDGTGTSYRYMRIRATRLGDMATDDSVNRLQFKQIGAYNVYDLDITGGTVVNATATGKYDAGSEITIVADDQNNFIRWAAEGIELSEVEAKSPELTIIMPANAVSIGLAKPITSLKIDAIAIVTVKREEARQFTAIVNEDATTDYLEWTTANQALAEVDAYGVVTVKNVIGTVILTAKDPVSGRSHSVLLRIAS